MSNDIAMITGNSTKHPDRGPDSRKLTDLLMSLEKSAAKAGGKVHALTDNHEVMNMTNDLRYVHAGEYAAFKDRRPKERRKSYFKKSIAHVKANSPKDNWPSFDGASRKVWELKHPLGYIEHELAWPTTSE